MRGQRIVVRVRRYPDREALQLQWLDPGTGRRKTRSAKTTDEEAAERARGDLEYELNNGLYSEPSRTTWGEFRTALEEEYLPGRRANTRRNYLSTLNHFQSIVEPVRLSGLTARSISAFVAGLRQLQMQPSSIAVHLEMLHAALAWAVQQEMLAAVPAFPSISIPARRPQPVSPDLLVRLRPVITDPQLWAFILLGWLAGLRRNEACYLEWETTGQAAYLDLARRRIVFPAEAAKANADQWVPLAAELEDALLALPRRQGDPRVFCFRSPQGQEVSPKAVVERIVTAARQAGLAVNMRTFRRGFACRLAPKVPAQVLQRLMRHASISVTLGFYANTDAAAEAAIHGATVPATEPLTPGENPR